MPETNETYHLITFDAIKIGLASPDKILEWSHGEVRKPETISYRTLKPEKDDLLCEKIFGPGKDWECHCGKYRKIRYKGVICDRCGMEVAKASVCRERMGHIKLAAPVSYTWYFKGISSHMGSILDISPRTLEKVLYFVSYIVLDAGSTSLQYRQVLSGKEYWEEVKKYGGTDGFRVGMGAEAAQELLRSINPEKDSLDLHRTLADSTGQKRARIIKRLEVVEAFLNSGNRPEWMIVDVIPVILPDIHPMVQLGGGRFVTSDLNGLYRRIINRNNRLTELLELGALDIIVRNEKRMLQEVVDALIDNDRCGRPVTGPGNRAFKSFLDMLKGKQGHFRQNLLGKRVDYSGRSAIVVRSELRTYQCGLPKKMAIELFKPFVMKGLVSNGTAHDMKNVKKTVERLQPEVWGMLEDVIRKHPVMLSRAPTLRRLKIQAFEPILVEGKAIKLYPLVCTALNADFDGDQMVVRLPLSVKAQAECRFLLLSPNNLLKPSDGGPVVVPSQDVILGIYYLTQERSGAKGEDMVFKSVNEAILAYENQEVTLHSRVKVRVNKTMADSIVKTGAIESTIGRFIFNEVIPQDLGFVDRNIPENELKLEVDFHVAKKQLKQILEKVINVHGATQTAVTLDDIKAIGYKYSTRTAMTVSISNMTVPESKPRLIEEAQATVDRIAKNYRHGLITEEERYKEVIETWKTTDDQLTHDLLTGLDKYNNIYMMADSGARGSDKQIKQLAGTRGLMVDTTGYTTELPIKSNSREGLDVLEYFISAHGAREGLSDTALRTASSDYLTRRLVSIPQDLIIREVDCCEGRDIPFMEIKVFMDGNEMIEDLEERVTGRYIAETIMDPDTGEVVVKANHMRTPKRMVTVMKALNKTGRKTIKIRTVLSCKSHVGVCVKCYGANVVTGQPVQVGEAVGIIAAQSIGESGTRLTMRTFHMGGVAGGDITQGLPRVEEFFEAHKPKGLTTVTEFGGVAQIKDTKKKREITVTDDETGDSKTYLIPYGSEIKVLDGQMPEAGDELTEDSINPHDILKIKGVRAVQGYMLQEVQHVYRLQGVEINDRHIEMIVHQMLEKIKIKKSGDSNVLLGASMDVSDYNEMNEALIADDRKLADGRQVMFGIAKASLATDSFLSAASFQETTKVLTEAAINGKADRLIGLKENVIIGKPIPADMGMKRYRNVKLDTDEILFDEIMLSDEDELILASEDENGMNLTEDNVAEEVLASDDVADVDEDEEV